VNEQGNDDTFSVYQAKLTITMHEFSLGVELNGWSLEQVLWRTAPILSI
jgi:hypothetical protein